MTTRRGSVILLFAVSGAITCAVYVSASSEVVGTWCTGIPFAILCAILCVRPWQWTTVSALLQCLTWVGAFRLAFLLPSVGSPDFNPAMLFIPGAAGAAGVAIAASIRRPWRSGIRVTAVAALLGAVGGASWVLGDPLLHWSNGLANLPGFVIWQVLVGTWLFITADV